MSPCTAAVLVYSFTISLSSNVNCLRDSQGALRALLSFRKVRSDSDSVNFYNCIAEKSSLLLKWLGLIFSTVVGQVCKVRLVLRPGWMGLEEPGLVESVPAPCQGV